MIDCVYKESWVIGDVCHSHLRYVQGQDLLVSTVDKLHFMAMMGCIYLKFAEYSLVEEQVREKKEK